MIYIKCEKGREFDDGVRKVAVTCREDAMWHPDPDYLKCVELVCPVPSPAPENGFLVGDHFVAGSAVTVQCYDGYYVSDENGVFETSVTVTCDYSLAWKPSPSSVICHRESGNVVKVTFCFEIYLPLVSFGRPTRQYCESVAL